MTEIYSRCASFLRLDQRDHLGITVVVTPKWFFLTLIAQPYAYAPNGNPVYLDGLDFTGLVTIQLTTQTFPGIAKLHDQTISVTKAMNRQCTEAQFPEDEYYEEIASKIHN